MMLIGHVCLLQHGESWNRAIRPKAVGAWNLHELSLGLKELEHFVLFSSVVSSMGHQGSWRSCCHDPKALVRQTQGRPRVHMEQRTMSLLAGNRILFTALQHDTGT